jgi:hypothetical protein
MANDDFTPIDSPDAIHRQLSERSFFYFNDPVEIATQIRQYLNGLPNRMVAYGRLSEPGDEQVLCGTYAKLSEADGDIILDRMRLLVEDLLRRISLGMGLEAAALMEYSRSRDHGLFLYQFEDWYHGALATRNTERLFIPAHVDTSFITLVPSIEGLEAMSAQGEWTPVPSLASCILVQVGLELEAFSGHRYKALTHRATQDASATVFWGNLKPVP